MTKSFPITEYKIVSGNPQSEFVKLVNEAIKEGWQAIGGVSFCQGEIPTPGGKVIGFFFAQAFGRSPDQE